MRHLRGFGKNYFTLAAIQAYNGGAVLYSRQRAVADVLRRFRAKARLKERCDDEDPPPESNLCPTVPHDGKPCHCNCFFRRLAWLLLHLSKRLKRPLCRCRKTKTGLAPPISPSFMTSG